jgi:hypothetical protein
MCADMYRLEVGQIIKEVIDANNKNSNSQVELRKKRKRIQKNNQWGIQTDHRLFTRILILDKLLNRFAITPCTVAPCYVEETH